MSPGIAASLQYVSDVFCPDRLYQDMQAQSQLPRVTDPDRYRVDRDREREKDMENFTKMLEESLRK